MTHNWDARFGGVQLDSAKSEDQPFVLSVIRNGRLLDLTADPKSSRCSD